MVYSYINLYNCEVKIFQKQTLLLILHSKVYWENTILLGLWEFNGRVYKWKGSEKANAVPVIAQASVRLTHDLF